MKRVAIVGGGPANYVPSLEAYQQEGMVWIGADQGAEVLMKHNLPIKLAIGDFDSISPDQQKQVQEYADEMEVFPSEKDETDMELALQAAIHMRPDEILLFGVTGGRFDHTMTNVQLLTRLMEAGTVGRVIDVQNQIELRYPGTYHVPMDSDYPYVSFLPLSEQVERLSLKGFYYPLEDETIRMGSTICISNKLVEEYGTFSFDQGILMIVRSRD
ncbi:thiamine diphosphokinase [Thalassobacillus hwangdonensis]|uniref:Thiamine diphosphokinase n=1 Tax=Thalassobacillus hwangdonensis TaxID=546108 RepID=A0ABW3KW91_9BACI